MRHSSAFCFLLLLAVTGCERANTRAINERRAKVNAKLDQIQGLSGKLAAIPKATEGKIALGTAPLVMAALSETPLPTGTVVYEQALADLRNMNDAPPHYNQRILQATLLEDCGALVARGGLSGVSDPVNLPANVAKSKMDSCANIEYVFVLRTTNMTGREFSGDVVVFEVATGKHLGGFPLEISSAGRTDQVTNTTRTVMQARVGNRTRNRVTTKSSTSSVNADADQLKSDLATEVEGLIRELVPAVQWLP